MSDSIQAGIVIIGAGQAGVQTAESLRAGGYAGRITLLGDEPHGPYHRPPLSKAWLAGEMDGAQLVMRAPEMLARKNIELRTEVKVASIDRAAKQVLLADGSALPYDGLVLATARPRAACRCRAATPLACTRCVRAAMPTRSRPGSRCARSSNGPWS